MDKLIKTTKLENKLKKVSNEAQLHSYINTIQSLPYHTFHDYFNSLEKVKNMDKGILIKNSGLERTYAYHILKGDKLPGRDKVLCLCIAAKLNLTETKRALELANCGVLYAKSSRDAIIRYAIQKHYSLIQTNLLLQKHHEQILQ